MAYVHCTMLGSRQENEKRLALKNVNERCILVVDDEEEQRVYFERALTHYGYKVVLSSSGMEGFRTACKERPSLVIMDVNMPGMDGIGSYGLFKSLPATRGIPILLATGIPLTSGILKLINTSLGGVAVFLKQEGLDKLRSLVSMSIARTIPFDLSSQEQRFQRGGREIVVDLKARRISIDGRSLRPLAARRFDLLASLLQATGTVSREELLQRIWNGTDNPNLVDVTVHRLRQDLKKIRLFCIRADHDGYAIQFRASAFS